METAIKMVKIGLESEILENSMEVGDKIRIIVPSPGMNWGFFNIDVSKEEMSVSQFIIRLEVFKFNDPIQRNCVWSIEKKSLLLVSILEEVSIGEIKTQIIRLNKKKFRNVLDGKQRLTTIRDFVRNRFALKDALVRCFDEEGNKVYINLNGLYFKDLPEQYQDRIMSLVLVIKNYDDLDEQMKSELFQRWNNGEALKPSQLRKSKMSYDLLFAISELKQLEVFSAGFSNSAINNEANSDLLLKALAVLKTDNHIALDSKTINRFLDEDSFKEVEIDEIKEIGQYLNEVFALLDENAVKKSFGASKTVTLVYVARKALEENRLVEDFAQWLQTFFIKDYKHSGYSTSSGTSKLESVSRRNRIGMEHYTTYFA